MTRISIEKTHRASPQHSWRDHLPFTFAMGLLLMCARPHCGFIALLVGPFVGIWIAYSAVVVLRWPERRRGQAAKTVVLLLVLSTVAVAHWRYAHDARSQAQQFADAVLRFKERVGRFPENAAEVGVDEALARQHWMLVYSNASGDPHLLYAATFIPYDSYQFDFRLRAWTYRPS